MCFCLGDVIISVHARQVSGHEIDAHQFTFSDAYGNVFFLHLSLKKRFDRDVCILPPCN